MMFKKLSGVILVAIIGFSSLGLAKPTVTNETQPLNPGLASPSVLLENAKKGRIELRDVIFRISQNLSEFSELDQLTPYAKLIPEFRALSLKFKLEEIFPKMMEKFEESVHAASIKWLDPRSLSSELILFYSDFASFVSALRWLDTVEADLHLEKDNVKLKTTVLNLTKTKQFFSKRFTQKKDIDVALNRIISDIASKRLTKLSLTSDEVDFWLSYLQSASGFETYLNITNESVYSLKTEDTLIVELLLKRAHILNEHVKLRNDELPQFITRSIQEQIVEILIRSLTKEITISEQRIHESINNLSMAKMKSLAEQIASITKAPSPNFALQFESIVFELIKKLESHNMTSEVRVLTLYAQRTIAPIKINSATSEGIYNLKNSSGKIYKFTLIIARDQLAIASLTHPDGFIDRSFFHVSYDINTKSFVASNREPDQDPSQNDTITFSIENDGSITLKDLNTIPTQILKGKKATQFDDIKEAPLLRGTLSGIYSGTVYFNNSPTPSELLITESNNTITGQIRLFVKLDDGRTVVNRIDYLIGSTPESSIVKLTSGRLNSGTFNHLRLSYQDNQLTGFMLVGARNLKPIKVILKKKQ